MQGLACAAVDISKRSEAGVETTIEEADEEFEIHKLWRALLTYAVKHFTRFGHDFVPDSLHDYKAAADVAAWQSVRSAF